MKKSRLLLFLSLLLGAILLTACTGGAQISSWPGLTLQDSTAYISNNAAVYAVDLKTASEKWHYPKDAVGGRTFFAPVTISGNNLVVGDYGKNLSAVDVTTQAEKWKFSEAQGSYVASPTVVGDMVIAPNSDGFVYALNINNGSLVWKFETKHAVWSQPVVNGENVLIGGMDHYLYSLDSKTGNLAWKTDLGSSVISNMLLDSDNSVLYVGVIGKEFFAIDANTGKTVWKISVHGMVWSAPILKDGVLYVGDEAGNVYAIDAKTGTISWQQDLKSGVLASPVMLPDVVVFVTEGGDVVGMNLTGTTKWKETITAKLYTTPVFDGNVLAVAATGGDKLLYLYDATGRPMNNYAPAK